MPIVEEDFEESDNGSPNSTDGEIFRNIHHYQQRGMRETDGDWLAKWSPTKCPGVHQNI